MTLEELRIEIRKIHKRNQDFNTDPEQDHIDIDNLFLDYINDEEIRKMYKELEIWFA